MRRISKKKVFIFIIITLIVIVIFKLCNTNITNIYISGNKYLTDQEIIDLAKLTKYPNSISNLSFVIESRLEKNKFISKTKVKKNILLNKVYINIEENYPLFYYIESNKTVLYNGKELDDDMGDRTLINKLPNDIYSELIKKIKKLDIDILNRISELKYDPNDRYNDRFLIYMNDGNYIYITLDKFLTLNKYLDIIKYINTDEKGIIRLDSGEYFDKFDE